MQRIALFYGVLVFVLVGALAATFGYFIVDYTEEKTEAEVAAVLKEAGYGWASARADGLLVHLSGPAPDEGARFRALNAVKSVVNSGRIRDNFTIVESDLLRGPRFSLEMLRNGDGISLIGLIPEDTGRTFVLDSVEGLDHGARVTDMLETADFPIPDKWADSINFALDALHDLPRSKISVTPGRVSITAITDSPEEKAEIEMHLTGEKPKDVALVLNITAPRPVISPFSLRLIKDESGARFDSCSTDTEANAERIMAAAQRAGLAGDGRCTIGLGAPTPRWTDAVIIAIRALNDVGGGSVTFSDADVTFIADATTQQSDFDSVVNSLERELPDIFSVHAVLPPKPLVEGGTPEAEALELTATKSPEGLVQLRGRLRTPRTQQSVVNFARSLFGGDNVHDTTRIDSALPDGWSTRVLAGLAALDLLYHGSLVVTLDDVQVRGVADRPEASSDVTKILSEQLGQSERYEIEVKYEEALNRLAQLPTPEECVAAINGILVERPIVFGPGETKVEADAFDVIQAIAESMRDCSEVPMEIGGHTDSQGRETMNQTLSQARAEAVLDALLAEEVLTSFLSAKGYGEAVPIADNSTEEGRALNRRIEFKLVEPEGPIPHSDDAETTQQEGEE